MVLDTIARVAKSNRIWQFTVGNIKQFEAL